MWVLEGDEVVAVNGTNVEGKSLDEVLQTKSLRSPEGGASQVSEGHRSARLYFPPSLGEVEWGKNVASSGKHGPRSTKCSVPAEAPHSHRPTHEK